MALLPLWLFTFGPSPAYSAIFLINELVFSGQRSTSFKVWEIVFCAVVYSEEKSSVAVVLLDVSFRIICR